MKNFLVGFVSITACILLPLSDAGSRSVDDDYYLNADVSFSCPLPPTPTYNVTDDGGGDDDYYGATLPGDYPAFTFFYVWMCCITVFPLLYFAYNNRFSPIGQVKPFTPESKLLYIS